MAEGDEELRYLAEFRLEGGAATTFDQEEEEG
jgi:hypothetical protein